MTKALIFDFDGVIVLSEQARFQAIQQLGQRYGLEIQDKLFKNIIGRTTNDFFKLFLPELDTEILQKILDDLQREYRDKIVDHVIPIAATTEFIRTYNGDKKLAVGSGSSTVVLETVLKHLGIFEKFACIVGKEHVVRHKPDPEVYSLTARQLGCSARDCLVIEDTVVGAQAALNAGAQVYVFLNGVNSRAEFDGLKVAGFLKTTEQIRAIIA
jgi:beta-phosphoglucomutase-like phosphatase (HAD superfamily)